MLDLDNLSKKLDEAPEKEWMEELTLQKVLENLDQKFTSGNDVPVSRATLLREEWLVLRRYFFPINRTK